MIQTLSRNKQHWKAVERDPQTDFKTWRRRPLRSSQSGRSPHCCLSSGLYRKGLLRRHPQVFPVALRSQASLRWNGYFVRFFVKIDISNFKFWRSQVCKTTKNPNWPSMPIFFQTRHSSSRAARTRTSRFGDLIWRLSQVHFCPWRHSHIRQVRGKSG